MISLKRMVLGCLALVSLSLCGCGWFAHQVRGGMPETVRGQVINAALLTSGKNVLIVPFSPGPMVAASDEVEHIALRLVKGMSEEIKDGGDLNVLAGDQAQDAQIVIKGRIKRMRTKKSFRFFGRERTASLAVEGEAISRPGGQPIAHFTGTILPQDKKDTFETLAEQLGRDIGKFFSGIRRN